MKNLLKTQDEPKHASLIAKEKSPTLATVLKDETGAFGIKEIAITVAVIVIIGFVILAIDNNIGTWVTQIWNIFIDMIEDLIGS